MSQQPFSRPGAVDLSALKRPAQPAPGAAPRGAPGGASGAYSVDLDEQNIQGHLESSMNAPVLMAVYSPSQAPDSARMVDDLELLADEFEGRFLLGKVDVDLAPQLAQALQIPSVPLVALVVQGRMMPLLQDAPPLEELRGLISQVLEQMATQGVSGRHQPLTGATPAADDASEEEYVDPRYAPAQNALESGDLDGAVAEYQKLVDANPADNEAAGGLAMAKVLQPLAADLDMLGGHVEDAFTRLIDLVRRTSGDERDQARQHLLGLFSAVGNDDPRVLKGRQGLASALF